jgi:hypothetical protein
MTKTRYPDLEIYIKAPELDLVADAITTILGPVNWSKTPSLYQGQATTDQGSSTVILHGRAYKAFTSIWLKANISTWDTDLDFALALSAQLSSEIRCSIDSWQEQEGDLPDLWWRILDGVQKQVQWG